MKKHRNRKNHMYVVKIFIALAIITGTLCLYLFYSSLNPYQLYINKKSSDGNNTQSINFTLMDQKGKIFDTNNLKGHLSLIYFGVTYSLDDYHALNKVEDIVKILKKENINVQIIFITLDPLHDTSEVLKEYLDKIDDDFIGLTGTPEDIEKVANQFKVFYESKNLDTNTGKYELDHYNFIYLISSEGKFLKHYCLGLPKNAD